jgi:hypothetical protein
MPVRPDIGSNTASCITVDNITTQEYNKENEDPNVTLLLLHKNTMRTVAPPTTTTTTHNRGTLKTTMNTKHSIKSRDFTMNTLQGKLHKST